MQFKSLVVLTGLGFSALLYGSSPVMAQTPSVGSAHSFGVLGGSTVTSAGASTITGDVGVSPGTAISGFPPATMTGALHAGDAAAFQAQADVTTLYNALASAPCTVVLTGQDLGGLTLTPGVYCFAASAPLNGVLTLDAQGNPDAVFIFQIGSTLLAAIDSSVQVINGARDANVFWQVGSSATLAAGAAFKGNVVALASITLSIGSSVSGRALARTGAVTMDTSSVSVPIDSGGCGSLASVVALVPGCGSTVPILSCTLPLIGQSATVSLSGSQASRRGVFLASPIGAPVRMFRGCPLFYDPASTITLAGFVTDGSGNAACLHLSLPASLCGTQWSVQALVLTPSGPSVSNAVLCTVGA